MCVYVVMSVCVYVCVSNIQLVFDSVLTCTCVGMCVYVFMSVYVYVCVCISNAPIVFDSVLTCVCVCMCVYVFLKQLLRRVNIYCNMHSTLACMLQYNIHVVYM